MSDKPDTQELVDNSKLIADIAKCKKYLDDDGTLPRSAGWLSEVFGRTIQALNAKPDAVTIESQEREIASKQARIDELMLEFCEDEMTQEQLDNWVSHQVMSEHKG